jgi:hypothetical protein
MKKYYVKHSIFIVFRNASIIGLGCVFIYYAFFFKYIPFIKQYADLLALIFFIFFICSFIVFLTGRVK